MGICSGWEIKFESIFRYLKFMKNNSLVGLAILPFDKKRNDSPYSNIVDLTATIREACSQFGLGSNNPANPLMDIIKPGMSVLLKPNWVLHYNQSGGTMDCMVTHHAFILAVLAEVIKARPGRIILGDAPIQMTNWSKLVPNWFVEELQRIAYPVGVELVDFRGTIIHNGDLVHGLEQRDSKQENVILFDLGRDSLLEPICDRPGRFRNTCYDNRVLARTHKSGRHQYLLRREAFDVDVIINLPKLKTHRKAGLTAALKNLVGMNADKDYLPHHRVGGAALGGDCYPGFAPLKRVAEFCLDARNRHIGSPKASRWSVCCNRLLWLHNYFGDCDIEGSWYGNDTIWRMVLDLNRILLYGRTDGAMADVPQRRIWSLTDGIVCGENEGPLAPTPRFLGAATFSDLPAAADWVHAALLHLDPQRIPLLREALGRFRWPLVPEQRGMEIHFQNRNLSLAQVAAELGVDAVPSCGWVGHCEWPTRQK